MSRVFSCLYPLALVLLVATGNVLSQTDSGGHLSGHVTLSSDYILRGLTRTSNSAGLKFGLDYHAGRWFVGGWLGTVDYPGFGEREQFSADFDTVLYLGTFGELNRNWGWQTQVLLHKFDGSDVNFNGLYNELSFGLNYQQWFNASLVLTNNEHLSDRNAQYLELSASRSAGFGELVLSGTFGYAGTNGVLSSTYRYADVGLSRAFGSLSADLRWHLTEGRAGRLQPLTSNRLVLSLSKSF